MAQEIADSTLLDTWGSSGAKIEPDISKIIEGWQLGEQPPHEYMNWIQNTFGSKLNHILKNGIAKWEPEKEFLAGATVQHSGNVWLSKTTNTNSAPTDVNANWKRIITVESLTTVLGGYVATTGNQTIGGVKTFSLSPIVPTPTTGTQAVNKDYADLKVALTDFTGVNQNLTGNGYQKLPGGLIIQWGGVVSTGVNKTVTFPIAFPTACRKVFVTGESSSPAGAALVSNTLTSAVIVAYNINNTGISCTAAYYAIGY